MRSIYLFLLLTAVSAFEIATADDHELLNQAEHQWLDSLDRPLIIATETGYHPYNFVDERGELSGVVGDYVRLLQEKLGFEYELRTYATFAEVLDAAKKREVDVVPLIMAAPERSSFLNFTQPAYSTRDRILTRQETPGTLTLDNMDGMRVGMVDGYAKQTELQTNHPEFELVLVPTELDGLRELSFGRIDVFISEIGTSSYYIQREAITNLRVAGEIDGEDPQTIATRSDWPMLSSIMGKGLANINDEEHAEILRRWISVEGLDRRQLERIWKQVGVGIGIALLILIATLIWTLSLRRQVARRTLQLQQELTERRLVEADKLRLALAVEQSGEFVLVIDTAGDIEYANLSFRYAFGAEDPEGRSFASMTSSITGDTPGDALLIAREKGSWRGQLGLVRNQGDPLKVNMTITPIIGEDSAIDGFVATARDLAKEEELQARVRQGERLSALGTLAGGIAHDFNNLLVPILGYTDLVRSESAAGVTAYLDGITRSAERARDLVQRIMVFGREESGEMIPLDLRFEIEDAIAFLRSLLPTTVALEDSLEDCGTVVADRTQIQQLLLNLCSNASEAMAQGGGSLRIRLESCKVEEDGEVKPAVLEPGEYAVLTVADTGIGMNAETQERIFEPYFSGREEAGGTGLGLAIVHGIVTRLGGEIYVESTPGVGSTFQVYLPTVSIEPDRDDDERGAVIAKGASETIMLVDDDELVLTTLERMLQGLGYEVSAWSDPVAALDAFVAEPDGIDVILADLTMPGLTGIELTDQALDIQPDIPFAIITGNTARLQGYDKKVIPKPVTLRELAGGLRELLG